MDFTKLSIESMTKEQFAQIVEMEANSGLEPYTPQMLLDCIENLDTFASFDGNTVVGFITMQSRSRYFGGSLYIVNLNVAKAYRGQGIAKKLMYAVYKSYIRDHADKLVSLDVLKTNKAMELYKKIGFRVADMPSRNGDSDVVMTMPLTALGENLQELIEIKDEKILDYGLRDK